MVTDKEFAVVLGRDRGRGLLPSHRRDALVCVSGAENGESHYLEVYENGLLISKTVERGHSKITYSQELKAETTDLLVLFTYPETAADYFVHEHVTAERIRLSCWRSRRTNLGLSLNVEVGARLFYAYLDETWLQSLQRQLQKIVRTQTGLRNRSQPALSS